MLNVDEVTSNVLLFGVPVIDGDAKCITNGLSPLRVFKNDFYFENVNGGFGFVGTTHVLSFNTRNGISVVYFYPNGQFTYRCRYYGWVECDLKTHVQIFKNCVECGL